MNRNDLLTVVTVAIGTAALTITAFWPDSLDAGDDRQAPAPKISKPKLVASGVEFSMTAAEDRNFSSGEEPVFELTALNTNTSPARATVHIAMSATSPTDALSRVVRTPSRLWQMDQAVALAPGERKTVVLHTGTMLPPNSLISVLLHEAPPMAQPLAAGAKLVEGLNVIQSRAPSTITALSFSTIAARRDQGLLTSAPAIQKAIVR